MCLHGEIQLSTIFAQNVLNFNNMLAIDQLWDLLSGLFLGTSAA